MLDIKTFESYKRPRVLVTHIPQQQCPWNPLAKYIHVSRNPRDTVVSLFHAIKKRNPELESFDDFFEIFLEGWGPCNSFFDHHLSWEQVKEKENMLFVSFEAMNSEIREVILKVAKFLSSSDNDYVKIILENDEEILKKIIENTSINRLKETRKTRANIFRKGISGDWVDHFNDDQIKRLNDLMESKLKGTSLGNYWTYE